VQLEAVGAQEVVVGIVAEAFVKFVTRLCECEKLKKQHERDFELAKVAEEVTKALSDGREGTFGPVTIKVQKKFLGRREVKVWLYGNEVDPNTLLAELSKAKSRATWLLSDCSDHALIEVLYPYEDRYLIEVAQRNMEEIKSLCTGATPKIEFGEAPAHVVEGIMKGVEAYLSRHAGA